MPNKFIPAVNSPHEKTVKREFTNFVSSSSSSSLLFFFLFKPAISLLEQVKVIIFPPSVSRVARGVHGHQAIVFLQLHISTVDREVHHSKHKTTPFLFEAGRPGGRVRAHTLRLRKFRSCTRALLVCPCARAHVNVYVHMDSLDPRPSPSLRKFIRVTFEPCAMVRREKAWKIFIT